MTYVHFGNKVIDDFSQVDRCYIVRVKAIKTVLTHVIFGLIQNRWIGGHKGQSPSVQKPVSSLEFSKKTGHVEGFSKVSRGISPSIPLVATVSIMALHVTNLVVRWSTTLTRVGSSLVGRVVVMGMRTASLVAIGSRGSSMGIGATAISGYECRSCGVRRLTGALEQLKTFCFRN
ncbi:hypothetical protein CIPAW_11G181400 [Carya illinoinensis]|uniref:Uncharacterized protein n=1 Tax=Carya illinoinensis TaxID=32201 RepID=A0A8T1P935_CARIL|nr:hypothetical protein CIPAW_11G181400 [Carya illinoinensis]